MDKKLWEKTSKSLMKRYKDVKFYETLSQCEDPQDKVPKKLDKDLRTMKPSLSVRTLRIRFPKSWTRTSGLGERSSWTLEQGQASLLYQWPGRRS
jgi:hypothetical protein